MLKRSEYEDLIIDIVSKNMPRRAFRRIICDSMKFNHGVMPGKTNQLLNGTKEYISNASEEELLWLSLAIESALNEKGKFANYFSEQEYGLYSKSKIKQEKEEIYPIIFKNALEVGANQWVTVININQLYELYEKQLINYNKSTQRPQRRKERNGLVEYKIFINPKSIKEITALMREKRFIPNTLTFNININDPNNIADYKNGTLCLRSGNFDIIDGFHRYKSLIDCKIADPSFDYNMILSIMRFDEETASQFIAQEDKRNRISKSVIKTMDSTNLINVVIQNLNSDGRCYIRGQIGRTNDDKINSIWLFEMIDKCFSIKDMNEAVELTKYLRTVFNAIVEDKLLAYDYFTLGIIVKAASMYINKNDAIAKIEKVVGFKKHIPDEYRNTKQMTKSFMAEIEKLDKWG